jgi:excisionase family DNA binding protein
MAAEDSRYFLDALAKLAGCAIRALLDHPTDQMNAYVAAESELPKGAHQQALKRTLSRMLECQKNYLDLAGHYADKELADLLRTSTRAIYQMVQRNQVPGVIRLGRRRLLFDRAAVLRWLNERRTPFARVA